MSWDFSIKVDVGGGQLLGLDGFEANYTYNVGPMFFRALGHSIGHLHGRTGRELELPLKRAIKYFREHKEQLKSINPPNGWGNYEGALQILITLQEWAKKAPKGILQIS